MEEEKEEESMENMDLKRPRKLNLSTPLLSIKRLGFSAVPYESCSSSSLGTTQNTRVPFSWEQAPGKPKYIERSGTIHDGDTPRLRLPPCLWHPIKEPIEADIDNGKQTIDAHITSRSDSDLQVFSHNSTNGSFMPLACQLPSVKMTNCVNQRLLEFDQDDGCDGDDDDDDDDKKNDVLSNAMDVLSLSEALDIVQQKEKAQSNNSNEGLRFKVALGCNGDQSPTYMINRFLPDATALAASSVLNLSNDFNKDVFDNATCASSSKACGMEILFPWHMKHKLCALKSPVLPHSTSVQKHHPSSKHKKNCSSVHKM